MNNQPEPLFVVGERVRIVWSLTYPEAEGSEGTVSEAEVGHWGASVLGPEGYAWSYRLAEYPPKLPHHWFHEVQLAKLPPDTPSEWEDGIFQPQRDEVTA